ncbi:zinc-dependent alcohol dehydrogenase family protein [Gilliamella sp. B2776]|uniref:zinc-dependent alcohol dehydrogenase family protein n=1 Tax=unclassified Gilliamella TaxID=2685620 RepID=UPI002269D518|nr:MULTISPECIES: zinc-dependent alcohol dehydrogenase family protein [unclassified Gilliamella]MCX8649522.1 zinc-dependent alcohol dehydrogenase family protein [Gilliamella sp. B2779]MCX8654566.1 zinc-dependent alcohol dehydrogenase family protein [Gilliamella sp. B2737]MCX8664956.1 zinc-dependent alcohol dehydrogenase family protein [Gilliamella sp. B2887]MCX8692241.1 zinc-dependent alcohol dehydrogenase family protein [Gilliamella sp. B2776]MCX8697552.1 zinc-dependent alcohol dehydrogenase f
MNSALCYKQYGIPEHVLKLECLNKPLVKKDCIRVEMLYAPINASDLIPITGAYQHRIILPQIAGYEGVGVVIEAPSTHQYLIGKRVLPLRGEGTWQNFVDSPAHYAIPIPDYIENDLAARAYINPVAAWLMLKRFPPQKKHILVTAGGADCAKLLCKWARNSQALSITAICRSDNHIQFYNKYGIKTLNQNDTNAIRYFAAQADLVYDAVGGVLAKTILNNMQELSEFISYGLLSGVNLINNRRLPKVHWFHVRHCISNMSQVQWQNMFDDIWPKLDKNDLNQPYLFDFNNWKSAIKAYRQVGINSKPLLAIK